MFLFVASGIRLHFTSLILLRKYLNFKMYIPLNFFYTIIRLTKMYFPVDLNTIKNQQQPMAQNNFD
jgi:hypothetical protein